MPFLRVGDIGGRVVDEKNVVVPSEPFEWRFMECTLTVKREKDGERTGVEFNGFVTKDTLDAFLGMMEKIVDA